ncbi:MAG TPA: RDD family protein [Dissulfurispiraceae bacterium]|nr:RDD family protein [Dissulfurispiraceae bacterium]
MDWYYKADGGKTGPVNEREMRELAEQGKITRETMVWNELNARWMPLGEAASTIGVTLPDEAEHQADDNVAGPDWMAYSIFESDSAEQQETVSPVAAPGAESYCARCFKKFPNDELVRYGAEKFCPACESLYAHELKHGDKASQLPIAGFCIRMIAKLIDLTILGVIGMLLYATAIFLLLWTDAIFEMSARAFALFIVCFLWIVSFICYSSVFTGKYGGTPGKLALGLRVVDTAGGKISYTKALIRCMAETASALPLAAGYIVAAFDVEKRALHDRLCGTRVIRKTP